jgi:hypothetical protein
MSFSYIAHPPNLLVQLVQRVPECADFTRAEGTMQLVLDGAPHNDCQVG